MRKYPASVTEAGLRLFRRWLGARYARAVRAESWNAHGPVGQGVLRVARNWTLAATVVDTLAQDSEPAWEAARAGIEESLDEAGLNLAVFVPRNAPLPAGGPEIAEFTDAAGAAEPATEDRLEIRRPVPIRLRRVDAEGSVVTVLGGLSAHWARFTGRVSGSFHLDSSLLFRLPASSDQRDAVFDRIITAASEPDVGAGLHIEATDAWTAVDLEEGGSVVLGTPLEDDDQWRASLRRNARRLLATANELVVAGEDATSTALVVVGASTYADEERLSWVLRGMDPAAYGRYGFVAVVADGIVKAILEPPPGFLPWDS